MSESEEHLRLKEQCAEVLHELGYKVFFEQMLFWKGHRYIVDVIGYKSDEDWLWVECGDIGNPQKLEDLDHLERLPFIWVKYGENPNFIIKDALNQTMPKVRPNPPRLPEPDYKIVKKENLLNLFPYLKPYIDEMKPYHFILYKEYQNYGKVPDFRYLPQPLRWKLSIAHNNYILKQRNMPLMTLTYEQYRKSTSKERVEEIRKRLKRDEHKS